MPGFHPERAGSDVSGCMKLSKQQNVRDNVVNGKRSRGRSGRNKSSNPRNQTYDSSGPEGKVRGTASQVFEKYQALARDAHSSGDPIGAENFSQHAEHYYRLMNLAAQNDRNRQQANGVAHEGAVNGDGSGPQPAVPANGRGPSRRGPRPVANAAKESGEAASETEAAATASQDKIASGAEAEAAGS